MKNVAKIVGICTILLAIEISLLSLNTYANADKDLVQAIQSGDIEAAKAAIISNANPNTYVTEGEFKGATALMVAVTTGNISLTQLLLDHGADVNLQAIGEGQGVTALMLAVYKGHVDIVQLLLKHGADANMQGNDGLEGATALLFAAQGGRSDLVKLLIENGADVNVQGKGRLFEGVTALFIAIEKGDIDLMKLLLEHGADANMRNNNGYTALMKAIEIDMNASEYRHIDIVKILIEYGADVNAKTTEAGCKDFTAWTIAKYENLPDVIELLKEAGATEQEKNLCFEKRLRSRTKADIRAIGTALGNYQVDHSDFPVCPSEKDLSEIEPLKKYYEGAYTDAWGTPYKYVTDANGYMYTVTSYGADKVKGIGKSSLLGTDIVYTNGSFVTTSYTDMVDLLLERGINATNNKNEIVLLFAIQNGWIDTIKLLIDHDVDINAPIIAKGWFEGATPLIVAKLEEQTEIVNMLKHAGAIEDEKRESTARFNKTMTYMRAIGTAVGSYQIDSDIFPVCPTEKDFGDIGLPAEYWQGTYGGGYTLEGRYIPIKEYVVSDKDMWGTPFKYISDGQGYTLTSYGADKIKGSGDGEFDSDIVYINGHFVASKADVSQKEALLDAALNGQTEAVKVLIAAGANVNVQGEGGNTALTLAAQKGHTETVKVLIDAGAEVNVQGEGGAIALILATLFGHTETVKVLIDAGANVNVQDKAGDTALIHAACLGHTEMVKVLIDAGADVNVQGEYGRTALIRAAQNGQTETVKVLIDAGADMTVQCELGRIALIYAAQNGNTEIVHMLKAAGAK